ncbi:MAG TPA: DUF481 domain-containing protein [Acidobacteriota bacterium]
MTSLSSAETAEENPWKWSGDLGFGFSKTTGNSDTTNLSLTFSSKKKLSTKIDWKNAASFLYGRNSGVKNAESLFLGSRFEWNHQERIFSFYEMQYLTDEFKDYNYRISPAAGVGYKAYSSDSSLLSLLAGVSAVSIKYESIDDTESYAALKLGNQLSWKLSPTAEIKQALDFNMDFSNTERFFLHFDVGISAAINENWSLKFSVLDNFDNKPVSPGIKKNDAAFIAGVTMKF